MATTPKIAQRIIEAFKSQLDRLRLEALASEGEMVEVSFRAEDHMVTAFYNKVLGFFTHLVAVPDFEVPNDESAVVLDIMPPENETWR